MLFVRFFGFEVLFTKPHTSKPHPCDMPQAKTEVSESCTAEITKWVFLLEETLESLESRNSLQSLETGRILLWFPHSWGSL